MLKLAWYWYIFIGMGILGLVGFVYELLNRKHIEKYGYSVFDFEAIGMIAAAGAPIRISYWWREYALDHSKDVIYPNVFIGIFILGTIFWILGQFFMYYQEKRHLGWLNVLIGTIFCGFVLYFLGVILFFLIFLAIGRESAERQAYAPKKKKRNPNQDLEDYYERERLKQIPGPRLHGDGKNY